MEKNFETLAPKYFQEGNSCSEAIAMAAVELGYTGCEIINMATSFSGGMGSGCLCGAVSGAQLVLGALHGKNKDNIARSLAREFYLRFTSIHKVTCCKVLTRNFKDFHSPERKNHCVNMVQTAGKILDDILVELKEKTSV
ncbi:C_GCAxxG_C_C family protein [bacterium]|nr:C_GCAxxG_C_C family protein [bacterium]